MKEIFTGILAKNGKLYNRSLIPGKIYFHEDTMKEGNVEYRCFSPRNSKFASAIKQKVRETGIKKASTILYLGSSHGYTVSFLSDVVGKNGLIFAVDPAPRVMRDLVFIAEERKNIAPVMEDAAHPDRYEELVKEADMLFQDVAQRNQVEIFIRNFSLLKKGGIAMLAVKARSVDISKKPKEIFDQSKKQLRDANINILQSFRLEPFQKDHMFYLCKK